MKIYRSDNIIFLACEESVLAFYYEDGGVYEYKVNYSKEAKQENRLDLGKEVDRSEWLRWQNREGEPLELISELY